MIAPYNLTVCQPTIELVFDDHDVFRPERLRANVLHISELIRQGAREWRSKLFVLPQASFQGCVIREVGQWIEAGLRLPGPETELLGAVARETGAYIAACGFEVIDDFPGRYWNSAFVVAPSGDLVLIYRKHYAMTSKTRPVDVHTAFVRRFGEDALFPVVDTPIGRIGAAIAGDVNWPEVTRCLGMKGAEIIVNPTATGTRYDMYGRDGGDAVRAARAFENLAYLAAPNVGRVAGDPGDPVAARAPSEIFDFNGALIARADRSEETMVTAMVDIEALRRLRATPMANFLTELQPSIAAAEYARAGFWEKDQWLGRPIRDQAEVLAREQAIWTNMVAGGGFYGPGEADPAAENLPGKAA